jgi:hypothetical protein
MRTITLSIALTLAFLPLTSFAAAAGQKPPRDRGKGEGRKPPPDKNTKWERGQQKGNFKKAVNGEVVERKRTDEKSKNAGRVDKASKWDRGQQKGNFKKAVNGEVVERKRTDDKSKSAGRVDKASKWDRGQQKGNFKKAVDGETAERKKAERKDRTGEVARSVDKTTKWGRGEKDSKLKSGQLTEKFNQAADKKSPPNGDGRGSKSGSGASAPPTGPKAKPPQP